MAATKQKTRAKEYISLMTYYNILHRHLLVSDILTCSPGSGDPRDTFVELRKSTSIRLSMTKSIRTVKYQHDIECDRIEMRKALKVRLDAAGAKVG
jgi:hypothetical protein